MENQEQPGAEHKADEVKTEGAAAGTGSNQSLPNDLKHMADKAKSASQGFSFEKLFEGRVDRMNYMYGAIGGIVVGFILAMIPVIGFLVSIALGVIGLGMTARRFRDTGVTGWATLICLIPFVGFVVVVYLCWKEGDAGANAFGAVPDPKRDVFKAILNT